MNPSMRLPSAGGCNANLVGKATAAANTDKDRLTNINDSDDDNDITPDVKVSCKVDCPKTLVTIL